VSTDAGVRPYRCDHCDKAFTQRCSLESHTRKVHGVELQFAYKQRRPKTYVCEECGHTASQPELHYLHLRQLHPYSPALARSHDKRLFKFTAAESSLLSPAENPQNFAANAISLGLSGSASSNFVKTMP